MAITVRKLYKNATFLYKMDLLAGQQGLSNLVKWVHIIEDNEASSFLHGSELVFTAGIMNKTEHWLLNFAKRLYGTGASAFVVNIGPHTKAVGEDVVDYCNQVGMPLFTIPWETRMVDVTRDFCHRIMHNETVENDLATTIQNIIFNVGDIKSQAAMLERYGCPSDSTVCFVSVAVENTESLRFENHLDEFEQMAERIAKGIHEMFIYFTYKEKLHLLLVNYTDEELRSFVDEMLRQMETWFGGLQIHLGISLHQTGIYNLEGNFEKALSAVAMAMVRRERVTYYENLGIFKLLYSVRNRTVLRDFYNETIGRLEAYDRENSTQLVALLRTYLENNGSVQLVSEKLYIHRNTVTNQLKRVEKITGCNPLELEDKMNLYLGYCAGKIL